MQLLAGPLLPVPLLLVPLLIPLLALVLQRVLHCVHPALVGDRRRELPEQRVCPAEGPSTVVSPGVVLGQS